MLQIRGGRIYNILQMIRIPKLKLTSLVQHIYKSRSLVLKTSLLALIFLIFASPIYAGFPGTNGKIAFHSIRDGNNEIYSMNADGSSQTNLSNNVASDLNPAWSPDGTRIAFQTDRSGNSEIYIMNVDGSNQINVTNDLGSDTGAAWSPDGSKIVFTSTRDGNSEIYSMNSDGTNQVRLTNNPASDLNPAWSPDGSKIVFHSNRDGNNEIYVMNSDGTNQTNLTSNSASDASAHWSPSGTKIVFHSGRDGDNEIYIMNADGTSQTQITTNTASDIRPEWSPDGSFITFDSNRDGNSEIYVMNSDGTSSTRLTNNPAIDTEPDWQTIPIVSQLVTSTYSPSSTTPMSCSASKPVGAPQLFQINTTGVSAKLHFSPIANASSYFISYGYTAGDERFGTEFILGSSETAVSHTINALEPNTTYYFKVRGGNGCMPGDWSNNLKATTLYQNSIGTKVFTAWEQMREIVEGWFR